MENEQVIALLEQAIELLRGSVRHINEAGLQIIKDSEKLQLKAYKCPAGVWTIGWGHTKGVKANDACTEAEADSFLAEDCMEAEQAVTELVKVPLTDNQFSALTSWTFNLGRGNLAESTMLKKLNAGDYSSVPDEMRRWNKAKGRVLDGLIKRREKEAQLWQE